MSSFRVEPKALRDMAHSMRDVAFDVVYPWQYADRYLTIDKSDQGLFPLVTDFNDSVLAKLDQVFSDLMKVTGDSHDNLDQVARYYEKTDHEVETRMDQKIDITDLAGRYPSGPYADAPGDPTDTVPEKPEDD